MSHSEAATQRHDSAVGAVLLIVGIIVAVAMASSVFGVLVPIGCLVYVVPGYLIAFIVHTLFPAGTRRSRFVAAAFWVAVIFVSILAYFQESAPHVLWDHRSNGGAVVRIEREYIDVVSCWPEPTEHDKAFHAPSGFWRIHTPPIALSSLWLSPLLIPTFVESVNVRLRWRTPVKDFWRLRRERRRRAGGLCEKCSYDMRGSTTGTCPECGAEGQVIDALGVDRYRLS